MAGPADGSKIMACAITEFDARSNSHPISTTARRDGDDWTLNGAKTYVFRIDVANNVLVVGATNRSVPIKTLRIRSCRPTSRCNW